MIITPKKIKLSNFLSYEEAVHEFVYGQPVLVNGRNLDSSSAGSNGSGKSAFVSEAVTWCLYGKTLRGASGDDVVREVDNELVGGCSVVFDFDIDGVDYRIERYQNQKKNCIKIFRGSEPITTGKKQDIQQAINVLVGMDFSLFCLSVIIGQDSESFLTSTDSARKAILDRVVDLSRWAEASSRASVKASETRKEIEDHRTTIDTNQQLFDGAISSLEVLDWTRKELESGLESRKANAVDSAAAYRQGLTDKHSSMLKDQSDLGWDPAALASAEKKLVYANSILQTKSDEIMMLTSDVHGQDRDIKPLVEQLESMQGECPTCHRAFDEVSYGEARKTLELEITNRKGKRTTDYERLTVLKTDIRPFTSSSEDQQYKVDELKSTQRRYDRLAEDIEKLTAQRENGDDVLRGFLVAANEKLDFTQNEQSREKLEQKKSGHQLAIETAKTEIEQLEEQLKYFEFWINGFGKKGIQSLVLDEIATSMTISAAPHCANLLGEGMRIEFRTQRPLSNGSMAEDFSVVSLDSRGEATTKGNSVGERQRMDCVISMALRTLIQERTDVVFNLFVCDEATSNVDREGSEKMRGFLVDLAQTSVATYYVTHDEQIQDMFPTRMLVEKSDGISRIKKG